MGHFKHLLFDLKKACIELNGLPSKNSLTKEVEKSVQSKFQATLDFYKNGHHLVEDRWYIGYFNRGLTELGKEADCKQIVQWFTKNNIAIKALPNWRTTHSFYSIDYALFLKKQHILQLV